LNPVPYLWGTGFLFMADVNTNYQFIQFLIRKNQTGNVTPTEYQLAYNTAQRDYYDMLLGRVEQFQYGKPVARIGLGMSSKIAKDLAPFKYTNTPISVTGGVSPYGGGIALYPSNFHFLAAMFDTTYRKVERIDDTKIAARLNSKIDPLSDTSSPFYIEDSTGWRVYPNGVSSVLISYYRLPVDIVWGYTVNSNGRAVYNSATSVQPEWDNPSNDEILGRAIRLMGVSFSDEDKVKFGEEVITRGE